MKILSTGIVNFKRAGSSNKRVVYSCDDGGTYTVQELAAAVGLPASTLYQRLKIYGPYFEGVFNPPSKGGRKITGELKQSCRSDNTEPGNAEWRSLGNKPRTYRIFRIAPLGRWERRL